MFLDKKPILWYIDSGKGDVYVVQTQRAKNLLYLRDVHSLLRALDFWNAR